MENNNHITEEEKKIIDFLKENAGKYYNIKDLSDSLEISYPTALKRVEILERLGFLKILTIGNNKVCIVEVKNGE